MEKKPVIKSVFQGIVVSTKMAKTAVVEVESTKTNVKYRKQYHQSRRFKIHDEKNECQVGDIVKFVECRPMSRDKRWRLIGKVAAK